MEVRSSVVVALALIGPVPEDGVYNALGTENILKEVGANGRREIRDRLGLVEFVEVLLIETVGL